MKKRILSLLMVGAMTAGMLAGCGSKTDAPADNTAKKRRDTGYRRSKRRDTGYRGERKL